MSVAVESLDEFAGEWSQRKDFVHGAGVQCLLGVVLGILQVGLCGAVYQGREQPVAAIGVFAGGKVDVTGVPAVISRLPPQADRGLQRAALVAMIDGSRTYLANGSGTESTNPGHSLPLLSSGFIGEFGSNPTMNTPVAVNAIR